VAIFGLGSAGHAQEPPLHDPLDSIIVRALESPDLPAMAAGLIDTIGGRLAGSPTGTRAEAWAAGWLRSFGLDTVYYDVVRVPVWRRGAIQVRVTTPSVARHRPIAAIALGYSPAWLIDQVNPEVMQRAVQANAAALLRITFQPGRLPQARTVPWPEPPAPIPVLSLSREDGLWLRRQAAGSVLLQIRVEAETRAGTALNVVGEWRGSDPELTNEAFLLGAHLDSWDLGDGALDNGTGVLAVMTAMQALVAEGRRPRRTVRIVLFAAEELGLLGSRYYVAVHNAELTNLVAMMNLDMVGAPTGYGATGHPEADTLFARLAAETRLRDLGMSAEVNHGGGPGSDHQPFLLEGVPTIYVQTSLPPETPRWYHNAADTFDKIDLGGIRGTAAAVAAAAWALADHPGRPLLYLTPEETTLLIQRLGW
jgi:hypothetical protein